MQSTIDHLGISAPKDQFEDIVNWYRRALAPLKYKEIMRFPGAVGLGAETPDFWIASKDNCPRQEIHFGLVAPGVFTRRGPRSHMGYVPYE